MAAIYHAEIPVDLAGASRERPLPVQFFRGDNDSHIFTAWVGDSANPEAGLLAGTVAGTALRGDGVTVTLSGEKGSATVPVTFNGITVQATPCRVTLPQAAFRIPGMIKVSIVLTDGETTTTVLSLSGSVVQTNTDAVTDPEELIPNLSALQTAAAQAIAAAEDAETAAESVPALVAPTFNTTTAYAAGDYVYYNGSIWRFTAAHAAGAWTGSDAVQTTVTDEYSDLKSQIVMQQATQPTEANNRIWFPSATPEGVEVPTYDEFSAITASTNLFDASTAIDGKRLNGSGGFNDASDCYTSALIPVKPGMYYAGNAPILDIKHRIAVYDSEGTFVPDQLFESNLVKIPASGAFVRFCGLLTEKGTAEFKMMSACDYVFRDEISEVVTLTNILTGTTWTSGWVSQTSGEVTANESYTTTDYISVTGGKYLVSCKNNSRCEMFTLAVYDTNKTVIAGSGTQGDGSQSLTGYFKLPTAAKYVRITYRTSVYASTIVVYSYDYNIGFNPSDFPNIKEKTLMPVYAEINEIKASTTNCWAGKVMASYGDSQTNQNKWQPLVVEKLGMTSRKFGISGATVAVRSGNTGDCLSSSYYLGQLDTFLDEEGFDVILIMGGTNDWRYDGVNFLVADGYKNILIGDNTDTGNLTFKGALKTIVAHLQDRYPSKVVALMSNIGGRSINDPSETPATGMTAPLVNANGYTQATFAQATKEIAEYIGIPFIDVYSCGINIYNTAYYLQDGLHINSTTGAQKVADKVISGLQGIQPYTD